MPKEIFYAVAVGRQQGLFTNLQEAKTQVSGFPKGRYKKFISRDSAEEYLEKAGVLPRKERFYAVSNGRKIGLFKNKVEAHAQIFEYSYSCMKKFFSREEANQFLEGQGLPIEITINNDSNPLFKKSFEKNKKKEEKKLKKLQESLGINSDNESNYFYDHYESDSDDFGNFYIDSDEMMFGYGMHDSDESDEIYYDTSTGGYRFNGYTHFFN